MLNLLKTPFLLRAMIRRAYWDEEKLIEYQEKKLREIVRYSYHHVPFYHRKMDELNIKPNDVMGLKDLNKLPIIGKDQIRNNLNEIVSSDYDINGLRALYTSGSTGKPLTIFVTTEEDIIRKVKHLRANIGCGQKPRDRWVALTSPSHISEASGIQRKLRIYAPCAFISVFDDLTKQFSVLEKARPDVLGGYSSSILLLAKEARRRELKTIRPRLIFTGAELIDSRSRSFIEEVFNAPVFDQYATIEFERVAWQCQERYGYHIDADMVITQFVDKNGEEVAPGETGQIVCTSLFSYAMPFIRYTVGDIGVPSNEKCNCGRSLPMMKVIEGRKDSLLLLPDGRLMSPFTILMTVSQFKMISDVDQFRFIQKDTDSFVLEIKKKDASVDEETVKREFVAHIKKSLRIDAFDPKFEVTFVDNIPLDKSGKISPVITELNTSAMQSIAEKRSET
jgi:phenylacetate-CoA ligase